MSALSFDIDKQIERALATPKPAATLGVLWRQLGVSIGDGEIDDPVIACRKLAITELRLHANRE